MALTVNEENYVKEEYFYDRINDEIKSISDSLWSKVDNFKGNQNSAKWAKITEVKHLFAQVVIDASALVYGTNTLAEAAAIKQQFLDDIAQINIS